MRFTFQNFVDRTLGQARLSRQDINDLIVAAVDQASAGEVPEGLGFIIGDTLNPAEPCEVLEMMFHREFGLLITWADYYPGHDRPVGILRCRENPKGYEAFQIAGSMMSQLGQALHVQDLNPPIRCATQAKTAEIAMQMALHHNVYLPRDVAKLVGEYARGIE